MVRSLPLNSPAMAKMPRSAGLSEKISRLRLFPQERSRVMGRGGEGVPSGKEGCKGEEGKLKVSEHRIEIGEEQGDLLGFEIFSGKLALDGRPKNAAGEEGDGSVNAVDARLTTKALYWGSHVLSLQDVISVSYCSGLRHFTVHAYPLRRRSAGLLWFLKPQRRQKDFRFLAASLEDARKWVTGFADQQCFVKLLPHPMESSKLGPDDFSNDPFFEYHIRSKSPQKVLVILNPRSGHGRSSKVFHSLVEPIFKLAGFKMEIVNTTSAGHAKTLASTVDFSACPDGIICVGGDGIVNEVLNGLLGRIDQKEAISIPIGIIPAGSDNSLVWTVLGVKDPVLAAITIVKGGLTPTDVLAVEWIQTGAVHYGSTVSYFGFLSDVLELSETYQKRFGPLRYFVAGIHKFLCLPKYSYELEYLPTAAAGTLPPPDRPWSEEDDVATAASMYPDVMRTGKDGSGSGIPRASSMSSIDSIMTPTRTSPEPSDYVRGLDPKVKRLSLGRSHTKSEPEQVVRAATRFPRNRPSKSRAATKEPRSAWVNDREEISSTISDPGPVWDSEPKWDAEAEWEGPARPIDLLARPAPSSSPVEEQPPLDEAQSERAVPLPVAGTEEQWVSKKGRFLGVLVCNHSCRTVQSLSSQVVAPRAQHDDGSLDLLLVHGSGRLRLLRFFLRLQCGSHLSLPYIEYVKVKSVKVKPGKGCHNGCGIDGELLRVNGEVVCSLLPDQCRLVGHPVR
ncbi:long-chain base (LCB) kinase 1 [Wolffia australiana]